MDMTVMTREWTQIANSIIVYLIRQRSANEDAMQEKAKCPGLIFNEWANATGTQIESMDLALWCVTFIEKMMKMTLPRLMHAAKIDGLEY